MSAIRAAIVASTSLAMRRVPRIASSTKAEIWRRDSSRCSSLRPIRVSVMTWSSKPTGASLTFVCSLGDRSASLAIGFHPFRPGDSGFRADLFQQLGVADDLAQFFAQAVVPVGLRKKRRKLRARLEQFAQGFDLSGHLLGLEILQAIEPQLDGQLRVVVGELIVDAVGQAGLHPVHHGIKVVAIDVEELTVPQAWQRLIWLPGEIRQDADDEGKLFHLDGAVRLHVIRDLHARRPDPVKLVLRALLLWHKALPSLSQSHAQAGRSACTCEPVVHCAWASDARGEPSMPSVSRTWASTFSSWITSRSHCSSGICPQCIARCTR